ncbi:hypothetical protein UT300012_32720 [Paraclostridium bifermentans]
MINNYFSKINEEIMELMEDKIKDLLCCIDGYNKDMSIEDTIDLLNKENKWIEFTNNKKTRKYILKDRKLNTDIAMFLIEETGIEQEDFKYTYNYYITDIIKL